ncbi:MAG: phosphoribosylglycinamide formyltransferase [Gammaproteobacteria bacterium]
MATLKLTIVVLISGHGSNLQAIIDEIDKDLPIQISAVISDQANAYGLTRARQAGIKTTVVPAQDYPNRQAYDQALLTTIKQYQPELIVLSGFMRILGEVIIYHYTGKIINIHPSLLPKFKGLHTYVQAIAAQEKHHGSSVHFVTAELDSGPIIAQSTLDILADDSAETLKQRTQSLEHQLYPQVLRWFAENSLHLSAEGIYKDNQLLTGPISFTPKVNL